MPSLRLFPAWFAVALASVQVAAQEARDDGPLLGTPFSCVALNSSFGAQNFASKKAGFGPLGARSAPPASGPDLRFERVFRDRATNLVPAGLRIDAISLGLDVLKYIDPATGILTVPPTLFGIQFTIEPEPAAARTTSGVVRREDSKPDGAATDVFDYAFSSSGSGVTKRDIDGTETGLSDGTPASRNVVISAYDLHLGAWDLDSGIRSMLPSNPRVFFSVPTNAIGAVPNAWWPAGPHSGATVLYSEWTGSDWSEPRVFLTPSRLGLGLSDDVDALAVEWNASTITRVVFSTRTLPSSAWSQLMFVELSTDGDPPPTTVKSSSTTTTTSDAGVGSANVASVCFWDPSLSGQGCRTAERWSYVFGTPMSVTPFPGLPTDLSSSLIRTCEGPVAGLACLGTGWTASGRQAGWGVHVIAFGTDVAPLTPWIVVNTLVRPASTMGGDPMTSFLPLPPHLIAPDTTRCDFLWSSFVAVTNTASGLEFSQAPAVRIRL